MRVFCWSALLLITVPMRSAWAQGPGQADSTGVREPGGKAEDRSATEGWTFSGFVDVNGSLAVGQSRQAEAFIPGTGSTAKRANSFNLNLAAVDVTLPPQPAGLHLTLVHGNAADVVHAGETIGAGIGPDAFRSVLQATVSYQTSWGNGLLLEGGVLPCHAGIESFISQNNWNYTRSWMAELSPYYQAGVRAVYAFDSHWTGQLHVLNGWQLIGDNNTAKSFGTGLSWAGSRASLSVNTIAGPELPDDSEHWRAYVNVITTWQAARWSAAFTADHARQGLPGAESAMWRAAAAYLRVGLKPRVALALRAEIFDDPDSGISGFDQQLSAGTVTLELCPSAPLILRLEGRHDHSTKPVFATGEGGGTGLSRRQSLMILSAVVRF
jgi:hypothetical protein